MLLREGFKKMYGNYKGGSNPFHTFLVFFFVKKVCLNAFYAVLSLRGAVYFFYIPYFRGAAKVWKLPYFFKPFHNKDKRRLIRI